MKLPALSESVAHGQRAELSEMLGINTMLAYKLCKSGQIPSLRLGHRIVIPLAAVEQMLANPTSLSEDLRR